MLLAGTAVGSLKVGGLLIATQPSEHQWTALVELSRAHGSVLSSTILSGYLGVHALAGRAPGEIAWAGNRELRADFGTVTMKGLSPP